MVAIDRLAPDMLSSSKVQVSAGCCEYRPSDQSSGGSRCEAALPAEVSQVSIWFPQQDRESRVQVGSWFPDSFVEGAMLFKRDARCAKPPPMP